jgi:protein-S-isoprenylcysteine O-methyltransferase Ste14
LRPPIFFGVTGATRATVLAFWISTYIWVGSEIWLGYKKRLRPADAKLRDRGSKWVLIGSVWATAILGIGLAMLFPQTAITTHRNALFVSGLILLWAGMGLRWYSIFALGTSFTSEVATRAGQQVMQSGPYRLIRHPSYTGGLLTLLGIVVCCLNWVSLAALVPAFAGYAYRIRVEEEALADGLGDEYRQYMRRTRRLIPFIL